MTEELDYMIKIIMIGDSRVGKTSYFNRLQKKADYLHATTIGVDYCSIKKQYGEKYVKINMWDTAGQERFNTIITTYFKEIGGIILMFNVCEPPSIDNLKKWLKYVNNYTYCEHDYEHPILLLGNKLDRVNKSDNTYKMDKTELNQFIQEHNITYKEISCKNDTNEYLEEVFDTFIGLIIKKQLETKDVCKGVKQKDEIARLSQYKKLGTNSSTNSSTNSTNNTNGNEIGLSDCCIIV